MSREKADRHTEYNRSEKGRGRNRRYTRAAMTNDTVTPYRLDIHMIAESAARRSRRWRETRSQFNDRCEKNETLLNRGVEHTLDALKDIDPLPTTAELWKPGVRAVCGFAWSKIVASEERWNDAHLFEGVELLLSYLDERLARAILAIFRPRGPSTLSLSMLVAAREIVVNWILQRGEETKAEGIQFRQMVVDASGVKGLEWSRDLAYRHFRHDDHPQREDKDDETDSGHESQDQDKYEDENENEKELLRRASVDIHGEVHDGTWRDGAHPTSPAWGPEVTVLDLDRTRRKSTGKKPTKTMKVTIIRPDGSEEERPYTLRDGKVVWGLGNDEEMIAAELERLASDSGYDVDTLVAPFPRGRQTEENRRRYDTLALVIARLRADRAQLGAIGRVINRGLPRVHELARRGEELLARQTELLDAP